MFKNIENAFPMVSYVYWGHISLILVFNKDSLLLFFIVEEVEEFQEPNSSDCGGTFNLISCC